MVRTISEELHAQARQLNTLADKLEGNTQYYAPKDEEQSLWEDVAEAMSNIVEIPVDELGMIDGELADILGQMYDVAVALLEEINIAAMNVARTTDEKE